jgi:ligand-binding SRPBCC domain-containing protein
MDFKIQYLSGDGTMYPGQLIKYRITITGGIRVNWLTEITQMKFQRYFVDEQRFGPYAFWHHQHHFKAVAGGTEMTDQINYALPLGWAGRIAHALFVGPQLRDIFKHRHQVLQNRFKKGLYGSVSA